MAAPLTEGPHRMDQAGPSRRRVLADVLGVAALRLAGINRVNSGEPVTFTYAAGAAFHP